MKLYRVQDREGRGPYRPGLSKLWSDPEGPVVVPWWTEMGVSVQAAIEMMPQDMFTGCAFDSMKKLSDWFTAKERQKLDALGFYIVRFRPDKVLARTQSQVVFAQNYPLSGLPAVSRLVGVEAA